MSGLFKKITSSYQTLALTSGLAAYSYMIYNKFVIDGKLAQPIVQEVLEQLKENKEVTEIVGNQFIIATGLIKSLKIKVDETKDTMEYAFTILGTKNKNLDVYFSAISKEHKDIKSSPEWDLLETEFYIPSKNVAKVIGETENKELLQNLVLEDRSKFWKIEYIEGIREHIQVIDVKSQLPAGLYAPKAQKRNSYFDVYQQLKVRS